MRIRDWDLNLRIRLVGESATNISFWIFFPYLTIYFSEALGKGTAGLLLVCSQIISVFANLLGGYCADRFGRKRMMIVSAIGQGIGYGAFALAAAPWIDLPLLGFAGFSFASISSSMYWPASQAMVADVVEEKHQNQVFATFYAVQNFSVVVGPLIGSILFMEHPSAVLLTTSLLCFSLSAVLAIRLTETLSPEQQETKRKDNSVLKAIKSQIKDYRVIVTDRVFMLFIIAGVLVAQTFMQLDLLFPVYLNETIDTVSMHIGGWQEAFTGEKLFGVLVSENGLLVVLFTVLVTKWMDKYKDRYVFMGTAIVYAASIFLFGQVNSVVGLVLVMALFTFAELMATGPQQAFVARLAPDDMRGQYFAASSLKFTLGRTIAPLSVPLSAAIGYPWTFGILTALSLFAAAIYYWMFEQYEKSL
ncbi:MFS transporter [Cohnella sp. AR92]|uniref:MDR family MFS transporter n=1 Tax=Cohnella sp. AR92 TaxID=648716 RepID=UPI000F8CE733|nr:MFS transporter [Cohnella sp. AR92]RUS45644.1 MFS transporter [Cohnella sp. AR92]